MKALVLRKHGGLDELAVVSDHPLPAAVAGHVVIRVRASSFNYHDVFTVRGMPGIKVPLPVVVGLDMAGEIALMRTRGFQCSPPISRVNSPQRPSGQVQPVGKISASSTISASAT